MEIDDDLVLNFVDVTGATLDVARSYLQMFEGELNSAISFYMENGGDLGGGIAGGAASGAGGGSGTTHVATSSSSSSSTNDMSSWGGQADSMDAIRAPIASKHDVLVGEYDDFDDWGHGRAGLLSGVSSRRADTSTSSAFGLPTSGPISEKASRLAKMFEPPREIMFDGDFDHAREAAKGLKRWMMVTISDKTEFACEALKRDLWNKPEVQEFIREHFIYMMYGAESGEGKKHINYYPFDNYPYFAIIDPRTGERVKKWQTSMTPSQFIQETTEFLDTHSIDNPQPRAVSKSKKPAKLTDMTEDEQLKFALAESMKQGSAGDDVMDGVQYVADEDDVVEVVSSNQRPKLSVFDQIKAVLTDEPAANADSTRIQFRFPDGSREVRRFLKTAAVRSLFEFVKSKAATWEKKGPFELLNFRDPLLAKIDMSLTEAGVLNASVTVEITGDD